MKRLNCPDCGLRLGDGANCDTCDLYLSDMENRMEDRDLLPEVGP